MIGLSTAISNSHNIDSNEIKQEEANIEIIYKNTTNALIVVEEDNVHQNKCIWT